MALSPLISQLIDTFRCLPGVGPKSAQRMALHLLERDREGGNRLAVALSVAMQNVKHCQRCRNFAEKERCDICENKARNTAQLCVVESPIDVIAFEQTGGFRGYYFVLMGHLSPLDGIGPDDLGIKQLVERVKEGEVEEVILATNPTVEGDATAHYIAEAISSLCVSITRIAHGVPVGGELEYVDSGTLAHALAGRKKIET